MKTFIWEAQSSSSLEDEYNTIEQQIKTFAAILDVNRHADLLLNFTLEIKNIKCPHLQESLSKMMTINGSFPTDENDTSNSMVQLNIVFDKGNGKLNLEKPENDNLSIP
jgi:hypothetical protein